MPLLQTLKNRWQRTLGWSNSRQSWAERLGLFLLAAGGCVIVWFGSALAAWQQAVLWAVLALAAAILLRRGWLKLFGPVLFYEMVRSARRSRYFYLRLGYALLLLFSLFIIFLDHPGVWRGELTPYAASELALTYFNVFMVIQWIAVVLLTPAYVAGTISDEKERKTLEFLLATDLRNREIVLSKLTARLLSLGMFLLTGLPILSLLQFVGGVDPNLVLAGFAAIGLTMVGLGGVSILNSVLFQRPRDAIGVTYLYLVAYLGLGTLLFGLAGPWGPWNDVPLWVGDDPWTLGQASWVINRGNPIALIMELEIAQSGAGGLSARIPALLRDFALFHGLLGLTTVGLAVLRLRAVALRQAYGRTRRLRGSLLSRPPVGDWPMVWKELNVEGGMRLNWVASIVLAALVLVSIAPGVVMMIYGLAEQRWEEGGPGFYFSMEMNMWVRSAGVIVMVILLLGVAVRAATAISSERDRQTWDSLMTSPLSAAQILWAKLLGCLLSLRLAWAWVGIIWLVGLVSGGLSIFAVPLVLLAFFVYAAFFAMVGLFFSMRSISSLRATVYTILVTIGFMGGHWLIWFCCGPVMFMSGYHDGAETLLKIHLGFTPPGVLAILPFWEGDFGFPGNPGDSEFPGFLGSAAFGLAVWALVTVLFWTGLLLPAFRRLTQREDSSLPEAEAWPEAKVMGNEKK